MKKRFTRLLIVLAFALIGTTSLSAQDNPDNPPDQIQWAVRSLALDLGRTLTLQELDHYEWSEQIYNDTSLGCPQAGMSYTQVTTPAYQFLLTFEGRVYDYRFVQEGDNGKLCSVTDATDANATVPSDSQRFVFENVSLEIGRMIPNVVRAELVPAVEPSADVPFFGLIPEHIEITFTNPETTVPGKISIYRVEDYQALADEYVSEDIEQLQALLEDEADTSTAETLPFLPLENANQVLHANDAYLDFGGGTGIRYLTAFKQANDPVVNDDLRYTFQGLTDDGEFYVSAVFPVSTPALPDTIEAGESAHPAETANTLDNLISAAFEPDLAQLDAIIRSLEID